MNAAHLVFVFISTLVHDATRSVFPVVAVLAPVTTVPVFVEAEGVGVVEELLGILDIDDEPPLEFFLQISVQVYQVSTLQTDEQPSQLVAFLSSHSSHESITPFPHQTTVNKSVSLLFCFGLTVSTSLR